MSAPTHRSLAIAAMSSLLLLASAKHYPDFSDLTGSYCASNNVNGRCCKNREDNCTVPILGTFCYCDEFCDTIDHPDCCPDYFTYCRGYRPPLEEIRKCYWNGMYMVEGETSQKNCNKCTCTPVGKRAEVLCEENTCLMDQNVIDKINIQSRSLGWQAGNYSQFWGRTLDEGILLRLGTLNNSKLQNMYYPIHVGGNLESLPLHFDSRNQWATYISPIRDQGWCGASWAISTIDVASDRFAIMSKGEDRAQLSAQQLLSCNDRNQKGCQGGYPNRAWIFVRKNGIVDEACYPWTGEVESCKIRKIQKLSEARCSPALNPRRKLLYKVGPAYLLGSEADIMKEIVTSGPVQAMMKVYHDFFHYKSGIYRHSGFSERDHFGLHSVRILGWGEESSVKYWIAANSWGVHWGERGLFRILRGSNECNIESFVLAAWPKVIKSNV